MRLALALMCLGVMTVGCSRPDRIYIPESGPGGSLTFTLDGQRYVYGLQGARFSRPTRSWELATPGSRTFSLYGVAGEDEVPCLAADFFVPPKAWTATGPDVTSLRGSPLTSSPPPAFEDTTPCRLTDPRTGDQLDGEGTARITTMSSDNPGSLVEGEIELRFGERLLTGEFSATITGE